jgi:hypothetical protein
MDIYLKKIFSPILLMGVLILWIFLLLGIFTDASAGATIQQLEEAPEQVVYQSRQSLKDQHGKTWQAIAFKRILANGQTTLDLRLVGFPGVVEIDHSKPLALINSLGKKLTAADTSNQVFTETATPEPNVAQYNLQPLLPQLQAEIPWKLKLPAVDSQPISLSVSSTLVQEWHNLANY